MNQTTSQITIDINVLCDKVRDHGIAGIIQYSEVWATNRFVDAVRSRQPVTTYEPPSVAYCGIPVFMHQQSELQAESQKAVQAGRDVANIEDEGDLIAIMIGPKR